MPHRAETILAAVETSLKLVVADTERARVVPADVSAGSYALSVNMGDDIITDNSSLDQYDRILNLEVVSYIKQISGWETQANAVRTLVHNQLMTNFVSTAPSYTVAIEPVGDLKPTVSDSLENIVLQQSMNYRILYSHSLTDTTA